MSDLPETDAPASATSGVLASDASAPVATAQPADVAAPAANPTAVVQSVVQTVTSHPAVPTSAAPSVILSILTGLAQASPAIFAVTRANPREQAAAGLGLGLAELILQAFIHPTA